MNNEHSHKWLFDGDCLICNHCNKAIDYHPIYTDDTQTEMEVPAWCPHCGDVKEEVKPA